MPPITEDISGPGSSETTYGEADAVAAPSYVSHATGTITFTFAPGNNGPLVQYAIYFEQRNEAGTLVDSGYLDHDGSDGGASALWHVATGYDADYTTLVYVTATGLTSPNQYKFRVDAKNEADSIVTGTLSGPMVPLIDITRGQATSAYSLELTTGNTKVSGVSIAGTSSTVTISFTLTNKLATASSVDVKFSKDGSSYTDARTKVVGEITNLAANPTGTGTAIHTVTFATCTYLGNSYSGAFYFQVTPYDTAGSGTTPAGDAGTAGVATTTLDNRPLATTVAEIHSYTWDEDTTPVFVGTMASVVCGSYLYFVLTVKDSSGVILQENSSAESIGGASTGWFYEQTNTGISDSPYTGWTKATTFGVPVAYVNGVNRWMYISETALSQSQTVSVVVQQAELTNIV